MARYRRTIKTYGKIFRTRAGRLGRYVYVNGRRTTFQAVKSGYKRAVAHQTYRATNRMFRKRRK